MEKILGTQKSPNDDEEDSHGAKKAIRNKLFSALFYGISSILVIFTNKAVLTEFHFPYFKFVATIQFTTTSVILAMLAGMNKVDIPMLTWPIFKEIMPISVMFLGNVICGLGSTKALNIPMLTALRRGSILMIMLGEWVYLNTKPTSSVAVSVSLMVGGALLAAAYDLKFDRFGYTMVFLNNAFTALNGVWMKRASMSGKCSKMGVLFYNSLFSAIFMLLFFTGEHVYYAARSPDSFISTALFEPTVGSGMPGLTRAVHHTSTGTIPAGLSTDLAGGSAVHLSSSVAPSTTLTAGTDAGSKPGQHVPFAATADSLHNLLHPHSPSQVGGVVKAGRAGVGMVSGSGSTLAETVQAKLAKAAAAHHQAAASSSRSSSTNGSNGIASVGSRVQPGAASRNIRTGAYSHPANGRSSGRILLDTPISGSDSSGGTAGNSGSTGSSSGNQSGSGGGERAKSTLTLIWEYEGWSDVQFLVMLLVACSMGSVLNYSIFLCTAYNSALTTAVVGTLKNVLCSYLGMVLFRDYAFTMVNFLGINISIMGSLYYTYVTIIAKHISSGSVVVRDTSTGSSKAIGSSETGSSSGNINAGAAGSGSTAAVAVSAVRDAASVSTIGTSSATMGSSDTVFNRDPSSCSSHTHHHPTGSNNSSSSMENRGGGKTDELKRER